MKPMKIELIGKEFRAETVDKENAERFYVAKHYSIPVLSKVVSEFENALVRNADFNRHGIASMDCGKVFFYLQKKEKVSFKNAGLALEQYVDDLVRGHKDLAQRRDVFRHKGQTHIAVDEILRNGHHYAYENTSESVQVDFDTNRDLNVRGIIAITPGKYKTVTPENAEVYCVAKEQIKLLERNIVKPFKESLCEMSTYGDNSRPFDTETEMFDVNPYVCMLQTIPRTNINYKNAFNDLQSFLRIDETPTIKGRDAINAERIFEFYNGSIAANTNRTLERKAEVFPMPEYMQLVVKE